MSQDTDAEVRENLGLERRGIPRWIWAVVALAVVAIGGFLALGRGAATGSGKYDYQTEAVARGTLVVKVDAVGTLQPRNAVAVGSELSGIVTAVHAEENDVVEEGQLLVELDRQVLEAQERQAHASADAGQATLQQAMVQVDASKLDLDRARKLHGSKTISDAQLEQAETAHRQAVAGVALAQAQLAQARASLQAARTNLEKSRIVSPIAGVVLERAVEPGQAVISAMSAATLFTVAEDLHQMEVRVEIDEADVGRVEAGQKADFTVPAYPDRVFDAVVDDVHMAPTGTTDVVTYEASLTVENPDLKLLPGMTASVAIVAREYADALLVVNRALRFQPEESSLSAPEPREGRQVGRVWVLDGDPQPVEVLPIASDGRQTAVEPGALSVGQELVTEATRKRGRKASEK